MLLKLLSSLRLKKVITLIGFFLSAATAIVSGQGCGTQVTAKAVKRFREFEPQTRSFTRSDMTRGYRDVPVVFHIITRDDGSGGVSESTLDVAIQTLNRAFLGAHVRFFEPSERLYHPLGQFYEMSPTPENEEQLCGPLDQDRNVNIYCLGSLGNLNGYTYLPEDPRNRILVTNGSFTNGSTLVHEMGHFFGLLHTHGCASTPNERADGTNCGVGGDLICDTPADPDLDAYYEKLNRCQWMGGVMDDFGTPFRPDPTNFMAYGDRECRDHFSPLQLSTIEANAKKGKPTLTIIERPLASQEVSLTGSCAWIRQRDYRTLPTEMDENLIRFTEPGKTGEYFKVDIRNSANQDIYAYILNMDARGVVEILFPGQGESSRISKGSEDIKIPFSETLGFQLDANTGKETLCLLYAAKPLDMDELRRRLGSASGSFTERLYSILGERLLAANEVNYTGSGTISFEGKINGDRDILPVIMEMDHR